MSGVPSALIRNTYDVIYSFREQIIQEDWLEYTPLLAEALIAVESQR